LEAVKQFRNRPVIHWQCPAPMLRGMARPVAPAGFHAVLARLDRAELAACRRFNSVVTRTRLLRTFRIASRLGDGIIWYTLIACLALFFGDDGRRTALRCAFAGGTGLLLYRGLKGVLVRERPFITHSSIVCAGRALDRFSFPSGHTLHAVSFTLLICSAMPILLLLLMPLAVLIALSRVVLGLHYPSDVLAGGALGASLGLATMAWLPV
jgi:undecaprenyl-diphosphatase